MKKKAFIVLIACAAMTGCAGLPGFSELMETKPAQEFCSWAPVAASAIASASVEALKDPGKAKVGAALGKAANYLSLAASQCPQPTPVS